MSINNLPAALQAAIQQGFLEHAFAAPLHARLGFRAVADKEAFTAGIGETITKTRRGLLPPNTTPMAPASNTDFTSGIVSKQFPVEQYTLSINQYSDGMDLNLATSRVAIVDLFLQNAGALGEQASRSVDLLARDVLFSAYTQGNSRVKATLGAAGPTIALDDVRGYVPGSVVVINGGNTYTVASVALDGSNASTVYLGTSGSLTMTSNVSVADGTAGNAVVSSIAPAIFRPNAKQSALALQAADKLDMKTILAAKASLEANAVPHGPRGMYMCYADPIQLTGLYGDPAFQQFFRGQINSTEYRKGVIAELLGVEIVENNVNPVFSQNGQIVRNAIVAGQGALIEGEFTPTAYAGVEAHAEAGDITIVDGIAHVTREPLDRLKQVVAQSWSYIGGFTAPSDALTTPTVLPTATSAAFKRAAVIQST